MNRKAWTGLCLVVILLAAWVLGPVPAFAMDEDNPSGMTEVKAGIGYTIQFARGDGSGSMEPVFWTKREAYELPPCDFTAPEGWVFAGWSVKIGDAEAVSKQPNESIAVTADTTVTAVWRYPVTIAEGIVNGTVTLSGEQTAFAEGETVTLTVEPAAGYALSRLTYTQDGSETPVTIENNTFTMPAGNVTVSATFAPIDYNIVTSGIENGTVTASVSGETVTQAHYQDEVTLTVAPATGYALESLTYTQDGSETPVTIENNTFTMPAGDVTVSATFITEWAVLNQRFASASEDSAAPTLITLDRDYTATAGDGPLTIPAGRYVTLDLNGHEIDRNLDTAALNGCVIRVLGTLTVTDSSETESQPGTGKIKGGYNSNEDGGGGVYNAGAFTLSGGTITGNTAEYGGGVENDGTFTLSGGAITGNTAEYIGDFGGYGGGVYNYSYSTFEMTGGAITGNTAVEGGGGVYNYQGTFKMTGGAITGNTADDNGGGVYNYDGTFEMTGGTITGNTAERDGGGVYNYDDMSTTSGGTFSISGGAKITGNHAGGADNNVYLIRGEVITIDGALTDDALIGVTMQEPGAFTSGLPGKGGAENFASDSGAFCVRVYDDGEAELVALHTVTFDSDGGSAVEPQTVADGETATRPANPTMDGYFLRGWYLVTDGEMAAEPFDFSTQITGNITLVAVWEQGYPIIIAPTEHGTITADPGGAMGSVTVTLTAIPDPGYWLDFESLSVEGADRRGDFEPSGYNSGKITLFMQGGPVTLSMGFVEASYVVRFTYVADGSYPFHQGSIAATVNGETVDNGSNFEAWPGDPVALDITPAPGWALTKVTGKYDEIGTAETYTPFAVTVDEADPNRWTFTMPSGNVSLYAAFRKLPVATFMDGETEVDTRTASETGIVTPPEDPEKEGYRFLGWYADGAAEAFDFNTAVTEDITLTAHWQKVCAVTINADAGCVVTVTADYSEENGGTPVASGDIVDAGTVLTVAARARAGYQLTTTPEETYTVNADTTITAASQALTYTLTLTHENGAAPTFTGTDNLNAVPYGAKITVTAGVANEGYEFIGWYQTNGKRLTSNKSYAVSIYSDATYEARYQAISGVVTFMANKIVQKTIAATSITADDYPADPTAYYGWQFDGWDKTVDEINIALADSKNITVTAKFAAVESDITVTIYNGQSTTATTQHYNKSQWITVTAENVEGVKFAYWELNGDILTYSKDAYFKIIKDCTLTAVYSIDDVEAKGTATIRSATYNLGTQKLVFVSYLTVPDHAVISAAGLVAASGNSANYVAGTELTSSNADYVKASSVAVGASEPITYTWSKTKVAIGDIWYARPYVTYSLNGNAETLYGQMVTIHAGTDYDLSEKATATIQSSSYNASTKKAAFVAYLTVPDGCTIVKAGVVAAPETTFDATTTLLTWDTATFQKVSTAAVGASEPVVYTWSKTKVEVGDVWYVRPYVIYNDANGSEHIVYGELLTFTA